MAKQLRFLETHPDNLKRRTYNFAAFSLDAKSLEQYLTEKVFGKFEVNYAPDLRQRIAENWPGTIDCSNIVNEIGVKFDYDFEQSINELISDIKIANKTN